MPPRASWNARRVALVLSATALLILAALSAPPPPAPVVPGRYHYYYVNGLSGLYTANPEDGLAGSLRFWGFRLLPYLPSLFLALLGLLGLALVFRGTRSRRR